MRRRLPRPGDILYFAAVALIFFLAAHGLLRKVTWYLAIDQYGYLTFAGDLAHGHIFHEWPPVEILRPEIPLARVDVRAQTYVLDGDRMYCRYTPGFPIMLAAWMRMLGTNAAHYIDPTWFLLLMVFQLLLARRLLAAAPGARWLALGATLLLVLCPSRLHLWAITILRDLSAQVFALAAILLALPRSKPLARARAAIIGLLLGYLIGIRIDAGMFGIPIGALFLWQRRESGAVALAAVMFAVGLSPLLIYNYAATGNPFRPTQAMEIQTFFEPRALDHQRELQNSAGSRLAGTAAIPRPLAVEETAALGAPSPAPARLAQAETASGPPARRSPPPAVQGGGLRLTHLPRTLPGNWRYVRTAFGDVLLALAGFGALTGLLANRRLFVATVPYLCTAIVFYSCWSRPDPRYLAGVFVLTPLLAIGGLAGMADLGPWLRRVAGESAGRFLALGLAATLAFAWRHDLAEAMRGTQMAWASGAWTGGTALPVVGAVVALVAIVLAASGAFHDMLGVRNGWPAAALVVLLIATALSRAVPAWHRKASFQADHVAHARRNIESAIAPGSIVLTTDEVGRPAENIDHYTHAYALYLKDIDRWRLPLRKACLAFFKAGHDVYLLAATPSPRGRAAREALKGFVVKHIVHVTAEDAPSYFVASRFGTYPLDLYRIEPKPLLRMLLERKRRAGRAPRAR